MSQNLRCNEQIRISPVRLIDAANNQLGVVPTFQAQQMAREAGLDLVEVAPQDRPPVCRIMDYGKFKYAQKKKHKKHHEQQMKEVRLRPKTDTHDRFIKVKHAIEFLRKGDKVQFTMKFRGRERSHREIGHEAFHGILAELGPMVKVERPPSMEGRDMIMILAPNRQAIDKPETGGKKPDAPSGGPAKPASPAPAAPSGAAATAPAPKPPAASAPEATGQA